MNLLLEDQLSVSFIFLHDHKLEIVTKEFKNLRKMTITVKNR
jgi:hypothetical protein